MSINYKDPYFPKLKGEYKKDEEILLKQIGQLPVMKFFEGWLNYTFKKIDNEGTIKFKEDEGSGFIENKLILSEDRRQFISKNYLWNGIEAEFDDIKHFLPLFHMRYKSQHSFGMAKTYSKCFLFLRGVLDTKNLNKLSIETSGLKLDLLKSNSTRKLDELNQHILNLLDDLNSSYKDYEVDLLAEHEESKKSQPKYLQTYNLINKEKFNKNFEEIYSKLVPIYFNESTTREDVKLIFSGGIKSIIDSIRWMQNPNQLHYFIKHLNDRDKISNGRFYKIAEQLFVDRNGNRFKNLKNNNSKPEQSYKIHFLVDLF
ncbi:hypothetical protein [Muriicola sp. Z0-33]|uniref:hypothetical protein n=1 Tax=Muriicola sp. Z0-33 TaxID=2816957 RepID=UPI002237727B|nr:hypothetical protein [Muriicola sp. Z0-33]MCW5514727.1 hypothetical protein [Muriicola sp. Z0-33]